MIAWVAIVNGIGGIFVKCAEPLEATSAGKLPAKVSSLVRSVTFSPFGSRY